MIYGALLIVAGVSGVPQVVGLVKGEGEEEQVDSSIENAGGTEPAEAMPTDEGQTSGDDIWSAAPLPGEAEAQTEPGLSLEGEASGQQAPVKLNLENLNESLRVAENFSARDRDRNIDKLLNIWQERQAEIETSNQKLLQEAEGEEDFNSTSDLQASSGSDQLTPQAGAETVEQKTPQDPLVSYLQQNPLSAILHGSERSAAMFGGRVYYEGDRLRGGMDAALSRIDKRFVVIGYQGREIQVDLPPLEVRQKPSSDTEGSSSSEKKDKDKAEPQISERESGRQSLLDRFLESLEKMDQPQPEKE